MYVFTLTVSFLKSIYFSTLHTTFHYNLHYINSFARLLPPNEELNEEKIISEFEKSLHYLLINLTNEWYKLTKQEQRIIVLLLKNH